MICATYESFYPLNTIRKVALYTTLLVSNREMSSFHVTISMEDKSLTDMHNSVSRSRQGDLNFPLGRKAHILQNMLSNACESSSIEF